MKTDYGTLKTGLIEENNVKNNKERLQKDYKKMIHIGNRQRKKKEQNNRIKIY